MISARTSLAFEPGLVERFPLESSSISTEGLKHFPFLMSAYRPEVLNGR